MRPSPIAATLAVALSLGAAASARADVRVSFADPARFGDSDRAGGVLTPREAFGRITAFLKRQGRRLAPGQDVDIQIVDFNLAGVLNPFNPAAQTTRVLTGATWPSFRIRYAFRENGRVVSREEELVADREYLQRPHTQFDSDPLKFEKNLLYDWFGARFVLRRAPLPTG